MAARPKTRADGSARRIGVAITIGGIDRVTGTDSSAVAAHTSLACIFIHW